jgi:DNA helicase-2/ATP-dependent DNA helicase PcrA
VASHFTVMDAGDACDLMGLVRSELGLDRGEQRFARKDTLAAIYSRTVNAQIKLSKVLDAWFPWCRDDLEAIREVFARYLQRKRDQGLLDYDDLLLYWRVLATSAEAGERLAGMFDHVLVDEYQDTNTLQAEILRAMCRAGTELMVVGDDAQAIYSFRSATARNMLDFPSHYPGANVVLLERNYRSTEPILAASNAVIAQASRRFAKKLWSDRTGRAQPAVITCRDESDESVEVCRRVLDARERGIALRDQAVLFRASHHSAALEVELARRDIPFVKYGGLRFLESAHVKDALCLLRILDNPADELGWWRALQLLEGIGPATARATMDDLGAGHGGSPSPLRRLLDEPPQVPARARAELEALRATLHDCVRAELRPAAEIERVRRFLEPVFVRRYDAAASRLRDLEQLGQIASGYATRTRFLSDLTLDPPDSTADLAGRPLLDDDYLVLSTIHSAKGCEWDVCYVLHAADGMIPSAMALGDEHGVEEELRLFYVALTRPRQELYVLFPLRCFFRTTGDRHGLAQLTRFLAPPVSMFFERGTTPAGAEARNPRPAAELAGLTDLWS